MTVILQDFSTSATGWSATDDAVSFLHVPQAGTTGGYIEAVDGALGDLFYYVAGPEFTNDLSAYAGGTLSYSIRQSDTTAQLNNPDVLIEGADRTIAFGFSASEFPGTEFTEFTLTLDATAGWYDTVTDDVLSDADIAAVLADVQELRILGEYRTGPETSQLDQVRLATADEVGTDEVVPLRDSFALGTDGWTLTQDGVDLGWFADGGKTNGYLQGSDAPRGGTWYFKTPEDFAGDYSAFLDGTLNYALFQTSLSSQFDDADDAEVKLIGDTRTLAFNLPEDEFPGLDWTDYSIALNDSANWTDFETEADVTTAEIEAVLSTLESIEIRGEYKEGPDTAGLDDFSLLGEGQVIEDFSTGGTSGPDTLPGTTGDDEIAAGDGDDQIEGAGGDDTIDGGEGFDTVDYSGERDDYTLTISPEGVQIEDRRDAGDGTDSLIDVEAIEFAGGDTLDLTTFADIGTLGQAEFSKFIEMYIAYFDRAPDALGLFFWGTVLAKGDLTLEQIADDFFTQPETQAAYPDLSDNTAFAQQVYQNVLGRDFDDAGLEFWVGVLNDGSVSKSQFILELLDGVLASAQPDETADQLAQRAVDAAYLDNKTDLGAYFSVVLGMSDPADASGALSLFDGSEASFDAARAAMDEDFAEATAADSGEFVMQLAGIFDDPTFM